MATFAIKCGGGKMGFSVSRDGGSATIGAFITGAADEAAAYACAGANVPSSFLGFHLEDYTVSENSDGIWDVEASYSPVDHNQMALSFDTSGGSQTITQSLSTINTYVNGDPVINFKGAIRPTDYSVEGCEIAVPVLSFSETHYFPAASPKQITFPP